MATGERLIHQPRSVRSSYRSWKRLWISSNQKGVFETESNKKNWGRRNLKEETRTTLFCFSFIFFCKEQRDTPPCVDDKNYFSKCGFSLRKAIWCRVGRSSGSLSCRREFQDDEHDVTTSKAQPARLGRTTSTVFSSSCQVGWFRLRYCVQLFKNVDSFRF